MIESKYFVIETGKNVPFDHRKIRKKDFFQKYIEDFWKKFFYEFPDINIYLQVENIWGIESYLIRIILIKIKL